MFDFFSAFYRLCEGILPFYSCSFFTVFLWGTPGEEWSKDPAKRVFIFFLLCKVFVSLTWFGLIVLTLWVIEYQLHCQPHSTWDPASVTGPSAASIGSEQMRSHKLWWQRLPQFFCIWPGIPWGYSVPSPLVSLWAIP